MKDTGASIFTACTLFMFMSHISVGKVLIEVDEDKRLQDLLLYLMYMIIFLPVWVHWLLARRRLH